MQGTVKWFNHTKRYGFIKPTDGSADIFIHLSAVDADSSAKIKDGAEVEFEVTEGQKGPQAANVRVIG